ncbi:MAG TPA: Clp protease N-terminal domain-containing protein [Candidatus Aquilonibacter sp.]|nr:Clp protease N-terminal domain-containing protein [Candidatus Aquilonibacter sp.]
MTDEQIFLSAQILGLMRHAAEIAGQLREPFITVRTLLLALLDDAEIGSALSEALPREKLDAYQMSAEAAKADIAGRVAEPNMQAGERAAMLRFNTLAFKTPDGSKSVWLSREAFSAWNEGAKRVEDGSPYLPKHLAFGIAADAVRAPGILAAMHLSPGAITEAILNIGKEKKEEDK